MLVATAALASAGCASPEERFRAYLHAPSEEVRTCAQWYEALDRATEESGVRDAQYSRVPGFPYLRVDRFFAALAPWAAANARALQAYAERLGELDLESRAHEINSLPRDRVETLPGMASNFTRDFALRRTAECGRLLRELDLAKPEVRTALLQAARVPDDYSAGYNCRPEKQTPGSREDSSAQGPVVRYAPPPGQALPRDAVAGLLARANFDPLRQPLLSGRELARVAAAYAPSFEIPIAGDDDRFGQLRWTRGAVTPEVDASELPVYVHTGYTRYEEHVLLQLTYTIWFPKRPARRPAGLVWRVTLAPDGEPLVYDSIHTGGCYHKFFSTPRARARRTPDPLEDRIIVPRVAEAERPLLRLASGSHEIEGVSLVRGIDSLVRYTFRPYDDLRSLPRLDGGRRGAFGRDGLTSFLGRGGFDAPDAIERRFALDLGEAGR